MRWKSRTLYVAILLLGISGAAVADWDPDVPGEPVMRTKWVQLPDLSRTGIDIQGSLEPEQGALVLADDWMCTKCGPVWDVHLWGSWFRDVPGDVQSINLKIYSDIPAEQNPLGYSMPGEQLWDGTFSPRPDPQYDGHFTSRIYAKVPEGEWFWDLTSGLIVDNGDTEVWQYNIWIDHDKAFCQRGGPDGPVIYWLEAQVCSVTPGADIRYGWKTAEPIPDLPRLDDAVYRIPQLPGWKDLHYPDGHPLHPLSLDLAFVITGPIPGDANGDGKVDGGDLAIWQQNYDPLGAAANTFEMGDWNCDGKIDGGDLAVWQQNYDPIGPVAGSAATSIPEPATLLLLGTGALGAIGVIRRRRVK